VLREGQAVITTDVNSHAVFCDRAGSVWLLSLQDGLHRYRPSYLTTVGVAPDMPVMAVYGIFEDRYGGIWLADANGELRRVDAGSRHVRRVPRLDDDSATFLEASDGSLWVGRYRCPAANRRPDGDCNGFERIDALPDRVRAATQTADGTLWFGGINGLVRLREGAWRHFVLSNGMPVNHVRFFLETRDGALWMATNGGGIVRYHEDPTGEISFEVVDMARGLPGNNVRALHEDAEGFLWVATEDRGLARFDRRTGDVVTIRASDGLYDDGLHTFMDDGHGRIWMSTNRGLFRVDRDELEAFARGEVSRVRSTAYTERDGMRNREANGGYQNAALRASDGRIWFATQNGAVVVDPRNVGEPLPAGPVIVEHLTTNDGAVWYPGVSPVNLSARQRAFSVRYSTPYFTDPERLRFRYRLQGFNADWVYAEDGREAIFTNVPPGRYGLFVSSSIDSEAWNDAGSPLYLTVEPFFHETRWFVFLILLLAAGILAAAYHFRTRTLRAREANLRQVVAERTHELRLEKERTEVQAAQLRELDRDRSRFFADVSHEFRTPLTLTIGPLQDVRDGRFGQLEAGASAQLELALHNARRLLRLTNQLLDLARIEAGAMSVSLRPGDLAFYLRTLVGPFVGAAERAGVTLTVNLPTEAVLTAFDPDQFDKVFANLLSNALKFTPRGGHVELSLRRDGDRAVVRVRDNGAGIDAAHLPRIFDRFFQGEKSEMQPGTGIGLSVAKKIADMHGASLAVESATGLGSLFTVSLPLVSGDGVTEAAASGLATHEMHASEAVQNELSGGAGSADPAPDDDITTVFVVDDNADIRAHLRGHLEPRYRVLEADDGESALEAIHLSLPDLIISDVMMPRMDGFALLAALRSDPETDFLPVILLTARAEAEDRLSGLGLGADDYVVKPFDARELVARVDNVIVQRRRLLTRIGGEEAAGPLRDLVRPSPATVEPADLLFIESVRTIIESRMADEDFAIEELVDASGQSRSNLYRRLQDLTGASPGELIRQMRLERAADLLRLRSGTVSEVAYAVGFRSVSHFSSSFRKHFGRTPTAFVADIASQDGAAFGPESDGPGGPVRG
jgi:signal transduction histidine kinase/CheY-like chemotaxis protein/AraC-like DNA-binding protein/streptogramin lyase